MKTTPKIIPRKKARRSKKTTSRSVVLVHAKHKILKHFRLIHHKHTGKLVHFRHTSHLALAGILVVIGFILYFSDCAVRATNYDVTVSLTVNGPAPTVGAVITSPLDNLRVTDKNTIVVSGTCPDGLYIVVSNNGVLAGSTICGTDGTFNVEIQIVEGDNAISALDYDNINQAGPVTPTVKIISIKKATPSVPSNPEVVPPVLPVNPSVIPGADPDVSDCDNYKVGNLAVGGDLHIAVVCVPRLFMPNTIQKLGLIIWGGEPPYAVNIDWSDDQQSTLLSIPKPGYYTEPFKYAVPGVYKIAFRLRDKSGATAIVQTSVQASGTVTKPTTTLTTNQTPTIIQSVTDLSWLKTPIPLYALAVALTLGFWIGDIFVRRFAVVKHRHRKAHRGA